jgi:hypothetical protein
MYNGFASASSVFSKFIPKLDTKLWRISLGTAKISRSTDDLNSTSLLVAALLEQRTKRQYTNGLSTAVSQ